MLRRSSSNKDSNVKSILRIKSLQESIRSCSIDSTNDISESSHASTSSEWSSSSSSSVVSFDTVNIREYRVTVGDNPSCSGGAPLSLGWHYNEEQLTLPLDRYEQCRDGQRRAMHEMKMPAHVRLETLRQWDVSTREIMKAQTECEVVKMQRWKTAKKEQRKDKVREFCRKATKVVSLRKLREKNVC